MKELPLVSIVIATFNSEKVLPLALNAIKMQTYPQNRIEILIIDGGSTDSTIKIANKYNCHIHNNPKTEPVYAKLIGIRNAKGKYLVSIDHDEVMVNKDSILLKVHALERYPECKVALCSGYKRPKRYPRLNQYISEFGDPFSLYIYNFSKYYRYMEKTLRKYYDVLKDLKDLMIVSFQDSNKYPLMELCCLGTMINRQYFIDNTNALNDTSELVHAFYIMLEKKCCSVVFIKKDPLVHYSVDSIHAYLPKLKWRICNNVHYQEKGEAGFSGRIKHQKKIKYKKLLFIPYSFSIIVPLIQGFYLSFTRKNIIYLLHPFFCFYTSFQIVYQSGLKIINKTPQFKSYDGKISIER